MEAGMERVPKCGRGFSAQYAAGDRGSNVTRSAAESGEAAWAEARTAVAEGAFHRTGSAAAGQVNDLRLLYQPGILNTARQKKGYDIYAITLEKYGAPGEIRTPGLQVRSLLLYPAELQAHCENGN